MPTDILIEPLRYPFLQRAFLEAMLLGVLCGVVGSFVVLRGLAFIGDALSHAVFPGLVIAYLNKLPVMLGAIVFGVFTAIAIGIISRNRRVSEDSSIGILFAGGFALGIVLLSTVKGYVSDLNTFLFGRIIAVGNEDIAVTVIVGGAVLLIIGLLYKELVFVAFDATSAEAQGLPVFVLDLLLLVLISVTIILSITAVGNILVLAMLVTPAATARLMVNRLPTMMTLSAIIGAGSGVIGIYVSYYARLAPGGTIVLVTTGCFLIVLLVSHIWGARRVPPGSASAGTAG